MSAETPADPGRRPRPDRPAHATARARAAAAVLLGASLLALLVPAGLAATHARAVALDDSPLGEAMLGLKQNLRTLSDGLKPEGDRDAALAAVAEMQRFALQAKLEAPPVQPGTDEAGQAAQATAFRAEMARLLIDLANMEIAILDGRIEEAAAMLRNPLIDRRNAGHERFQVDE